MLAISLTGWKTACRDFTEFSMGGCDLVQKLSMDMGCMKSFTYKASYEQNAEATFFPKPSFSNSRCIKFRLWEKDQSSVWTGNTSGILELCIEPGYYYKCLS